MQILSFLILLFPIMAQAAELPGGAPLPGNIDDLAKGMATYFPKGTGKVVSVDQNGIHIEMKNGSQGSQTSYPPGLSEGVLLSAYREEEPFYHPVTGVVLGRFEKEIALLEVVAIQQDQIVARGILPETPVLPTDRVRLTAAKIPMGVTAGSLESDRFLLQEFLLALEETGRFKTMLLPAQSTLDEAAATGNLYLIVFTTRLPVLENSASPSIRVQMQNVKTGRALSAMEVGLEALEESDFIVESLQHRLFEKHQKGVRP